MHQSTPTVSSRALPPPLSQRQERVVELVTSYLQVAQEMPSAGWLARRLSISRQRARQHMLTLRDRGWFERS